jgi:predicted DsbA family dithiol-disulfide isomerase
MQTRAMKLIVYGDFNCPYSCLANVRVDALIARGSADVDWRAVEHDPAIPAPSRPASGEVAEMFDRELAEIRSLLAADEAFPITRPPVQPNTRRAIDAFASAPADERDGVRRRLFAALWFEGRDTGDPAVVAELAGRIAREPDERAAEWQAEWSGYERRVVPMLILPDGYVSRGLGALARLADLAA